MELKIFAPNVHTGGGLVLLKSLLGEWPSTHTLIAWVDIRARSHISLPLKSNITWVRPTFFSRLSAEIGLAQSCNDQDRVILFHGLPPLYPLKAKVIVFLQNRNFISNINYSIFSARTRLRIFIERAYGRLLRHRVNVYFVQTPSMVAMLKKWYGSNSVDVRIAPITPSLKITPSAQLKEWDFLYIADGEAHKNHRALVEAWKILAQQGVFPTLALTLSERDHELILWIAGQRELYGLKIENLGNLPNIEVLELYGRASALIFPSISESFGLPLVEASFFKLPILAGELDFVRDVCDPVESFDPNSAISIARAVKRFLQISECPLQPLSGRSFFEMVLSIS